MDPYVIVGASLAGAKAAETLREEGFDGPVVLIGDEDERAVRAAAAVQGLPARQGPARGGRPSTRPGWYDRARRRPAARQPGHARSTRPSTTVELAGGERIALRQAAAGHRLAGRAGWTCPAPT